MESATENTHFKTDLTGATAAMDPNRSASPFTLTSQLPAVSVNSSDSKERHKSGGALALLKKWNPYGAVPIAAILIPYWAVKFFRGMTRVLHHNYDNIVYQIRRPDALADKIKAFKYFVVGGSIFPLGFAALMFYTLRFSPDASLQAIAAPLDSRHKQLPLLPFNLENSIRRSVARMKAYLEQAVQATIGNREDWKDLVKRSRNSQVILLERETSRLGFHELLPQSHRERVHQALQEGALDSIKPAK